MRRGGDLFHPANRSAAARYASSRAARCGITRDWSLAQAPSWEPRGRSAKYASVAARSIRSTRPATTTCRCMGNQGNTRLAYGLAATSAPLREPWLVNRTKPSGSYPLSSTVRPLGRPAASAVPKTIALGSGNPAATASANQRANWVCQSPARPASVSPVSAVYSCRIAAGGGVSPVTFPPLPVGAVPAP